MTPLISKEEIRSLNYTVNFSPPATSYRPLKHWSKDSGRAIDSRLYQGLRGLIRLLRWPRHPTITKADSHHCPQQNTDGAALFRVQRVFSEKYQPKPKVTYKIMQEYGEKKYGFGMNTAYTAKVKRPLGLTMYDVSNAVEELKQLRKHPPKVKIEAITDALKYFEVI